MPTINHEGVELFYDRTGSGEPVVLTHGAFSDGRTWAALTERLSDRFEVVTWDRRGHSRSGDGQGPGSFREDALDLAALIEQLGLAPALVIGSSAGGSVVLNLVTTRPELVKMALVNEPVPLGILRLGGDADLIELLEHEQHMADHAEQLIAQGEPREAARYFIDEIAVGAGAFDSFPEELQDILVANAHTLSDDLRDAWDASSVDVEALAESSVPLVISTGTESPLLERAAVQELAKRVPRARIEVLQAAGHIPYRTHPDLFAALVSRHFSGVAAGVD